MSWLIFAGRRSATSVTELRTVSGAGPKYSKPADFLLPDATVITMEDRRNVTDEFKGKSETDIVAELDSRGVELEIAIENLERDFNMGTIVRSANAFGVRTVHVIGRRQWNKRGAMMTDKYLTVLYHDTVEAFINAMRARGIAMVVAVDIVDGAMDIRDIDKSAKAVLVFGAEGPGLSTKLRQAADLVAMIPQRGSTRSINVGVAAGIAIWEWLR